MTNPGKSHTPQVRNHAMQNHIELAQTTDLHQYPKFHNMPNIRNGDHRVNGSIQSNGSVVHHHINTTPAYNQTQESGKILISSL